MSSPSLSVPVSGSVRALVVEGVSVRESVPSSDDVEIVGNQKPISGPRMSIDLLISSKGLARGTQRATGGVHPGGMIIRERHEFTRKFYDAVKQQLNVLTYLA